jgi:hypothetical protein
VRVGTVETVLMVSVLPGAFRGASSVTRGTHNLK